MEGLIPMEPGEPDSLFNGEVETGVRALLILESVHPRRMDLSSLSLFDYFVVHTADIGGPSSLHPDLSSRPGEYRVRRRLIEAALKLMARLHLIEIHNTEQGILFEAADDAPAMLDLMSAPYNGALRQRAEWLARQASEFGYEAFDERMRKSIETLSLAFETPTSLAESAP